MSNFKAQRFEGILFSDGRPVSIEVINGKISDIKYLPKYRPVPDLIIAPGLVDIQINGYMGVDFSSQELNVEDLRKATRSLWTKGITTFLPTVVPNESAKMNNSFSLLSTAIKDEEIGKSVPGFHLESPYISPLPGYRGAHLEKYIRPPDWNEFLQFQTSSGDMIKLITLAPEVEGAIPFINQCVKSGVIVSLGHHNGTAQDINAAVEAGSCLSTHLGNGCANLIDRHLNPLWPQLANDNLSASIIADGFHLTREELISFLKIKGPERTILVSDAVDLAGLPPGEYFRREKRLILTPENVVRFPSENVLAGAASPISTCVGNIMKFTGCSLANAIQMATKNPASLTGLTDIGEIKEGKRANLILFKIEEYRMTIYKTIIDGKIVYSSDSN